MLRVLLGIWLLLVLCGLLGAVVAWLLSVSKPPSSPTNRPIGVRRYPVSDGPFTEDVNPEEDEQMRSGDEG